MYRRAADVLAKAWPSSDGKVDAGRLRKANRVYTRVGDDGAVIVWLGTDRFRRARGQTAQPALDSATARKVGDDIQKLTNDIYNQQVQAGLNKIFSKLGK